MQILRVPGANDTESGPASSAPVIPESLNRMPYEALAAE